MTTGEQCGPFEGKDIDSWLLQTNDAEMEALHWSDSYSMSIVGRSRRRNVILG